MNYKLNAPAEVQQRDAKNTGMSADYKNVRLENTKEVTNMLQTLGPFMRAGLIDKDMVQKAIINPSKGTIQDLLNHINQLTKGTEVNGEFNQLS